MPDLSLVIRQLARIAAEAEGHAPGCAFVIRDGGILACSCGELRFQVVRPLALAAAQGARTGGAA